MSYLRPSPSNEVIINSLSDFVNDGTKIILKTGTRYILNSVIVSPYYLQIPTGGSCNFEAVDLTNAFVYTGSGAAIRGTSFGIFQTNLVIFQAPAGSFYDLDNAGSVFSINTIYQNAQSFGTVKCGTFTFFFNQLAVIGSGGVFSDRTDLVKRSQVSFSNSTCLSWNNEVTNFFNISGNIEAVQIQNSRATCGSNERVFLLDPSLRDNNTSILINGLNLVAASEDQLLATGSLDQSYFRSSWLGIVGGANSTISIEVDILGNTGVTTIASANTDYLINAQFFSSLRERMFLRDRCIAAAATNIFTSTYLDGITTFSHGMSDGDLVFVKAGIGGTLPTGLTENTNYFVVSSAATTFKLSASSGGAEIDITDAGVGTFYFDHERTNNVASWVIYKGTEKSNISVVGHINAKRQSGGTDNRFYASLYKTDINLAETEVEQGGLATINFTDVGSSVLVALQRMVTNEGFRFYVANGTGANDLIVESASIVIKK